jgi:hypothetical protein
MTAGDLAVAWKDWKLCARNDETPGGDTTYSYCIIAKRRIVNGSDRIGRNRLRIVVA